MRPVLFFQDCFGYLCVCLAIFVKFQNQLFYFSEKKSHWNFGRNCTESVDCFEQHGYFNDINFSNP